MLLLSFKQIAYTSMKATHHSNTNSTFGFPFAFGEVELIGRQLARDGLHNWLHLGNEPTVPINGKEMQHTEVSLSATAARLVCESVLHF
jgi:hypothetical protein